MPEVSVIIPNYNHSNYLHQRIQSVLQQTYQNFEVILLDDCSTDNSREVIEQYRSDSRVKAIVYNDVNSGSTFKQWLKGIQLAKGNYIWIAESDDWCEPTFLENILPHMLQRPECVIGYCQAYCVVGNAIKSQSAHPYLSDFIEGETFLKDYMVSGNAIYNASMAVWKKEAFNNIPLDFTEYKFCGDWLFWIELCSRGTVFVSGRVLDYFRKHENDVTGKATRTGQNFVEELQLLNTLLNRNIIVKSRYHKELTFKFLQYNLRRKEFLPAIRLKAEAQFTKEISHLSLYTNYIRLGVKYKGYQFLKKFIQNNK